MSKRLSEKEFSDALGVPTIDAEFRKMSVEEIYQACYDIIIKAAELYNEIYGINQDELISEANMAFLHAISLGSYNMYDNTGHRVQIIKMAINRRLYRYCEKEMERQSYLVRYSDCYEVTNPDSLYYQVTNRVVLSSLDVLNDRDRAVIYMYFWQGKSFTAIGEILGISRDRVRQLWYRSLRVLSGRRTASILYPLLKQFN